MLLYICIIYSSYALNIHWFCRTAMQLNKFVFFFAEFAKCKLNFTQHRDNCLHIAGKIGMASSLTKRVPSKKNSSHTLSNTSQIKQPWLLLSKTICSSWVLVTPVFIKWTSSSIFLTDNICLMPIDRFFNCPLLFQAKKITSSTVATSDHISRAFFSFLD